VVKIHADSVAEGLLELNDRVLSINGQSTLGIDHNEVIDILESTLHSSSRILAIEVEACTMHLHVPANSPALEQSEECQEEVGAPDKRDPSAVPLVGASGAAAPIVGTSEDMAAGFAALSPHQRAVVVHVARVRVLFC
jgi:hypothetical protein